MIIPSLSVVCKDRLRQAPPVSLLFEVQTHISRRSLGRIRKFGRRREPTSITIASDFGCQLAIMFETLQKRG